MEGWNEFVKQFITLGGYKRVINGLLATVEIAVFGLIIGIIIGLLIAIVKVVPKTNVFLKIADKICLTYVAFFRGTPMIVQLLVGHFILLPLLGVSVVSVVEAIIIFGLNSGAYVSEIMRGGINSIDKGQLEAGRALGLPYGKAMLKIVIPQSIKNISAARDFFSNSSFTIKSCTIYNPPQYSIIASFAFVLQRHRAKPTPLQC